MKRIILVSILLLAAGFSQAIYKSGGEARLSPRLLNYQGFLTDTLGNPITNPSVSMTFAIFDAVSAGNQKWTETQSTVSVDKGIFHVLLGSVTPVPDSVFAASTNRWLALTVAGQILSPRTRIVTAPYAYIATYSDTAMYAKNATADNDWIRSGGKVYAYNLTDSVGVRTNTPRYAFDVNGIICGGTSDTINALYGGVLSGYSNLAGDTVTDTFAVVTGGYDNSATGKYTFVGNGRLNYAETTYAAVVGGLNNIAGGYNAFIGGGETNIARGYCSFIGGGWRNRVDSVDAAVVGGYRNYAYGHYSFIGGGQNDSVLSRAGGVVSGYHNRAGDELIDTAAIVVGGGNNAAIEKYAFVGGGFSDTANSAWSVICGGFGNSSTTAAYGVVAGGRYNHVSNTYATVGGGGYNSVDGIAGSIPGGVDDTVSGIYGFAAGYHSKAISSWANSAAFTGSHTTGTEQVRAAAFSTGAVDFAMDHPDDPMNKILNQYGVGSNEMMLIYRGSVVLDGNGRAVVSLPDYFDDINQNPMVQLTGVGTYEVFVAEDVKGNSFKVGGKPNTKVYWTVTAERKDIQARIAYVKTPVVQEKIGSLRGHSLDDDALICIYDGLQQDYPGQFTFRTEEGRRVHEQSKKLVQENENK